MQGYTGYGAALCRSYLSYMDRKGRLGYIEELAKGKFEVIELLCAEVENDSLNWETYPPLPIIFKSEFE